MRAVNECRCVVDGTKSKLKLTVTQVSVSFLKKKGIKVKNKNQIKNVLKKKKK